VQGWWAASYVVLWLVVVALAVVVVALARQLGTRHLRLGPRGALEVDAEGPPLGEALPPIDARRVDGESVTIGGPGEPHLLLFASPECRVCEEVMPALRAVSSAAGLRPFVVTDLDRDEAQRAFSGAHPPATLVAAPEIVRAYDIPGTPFVIIVDELGVVRAKGTPNNLEQMEGLVDTARRRMATTTRAEHAS
jgi:methylamine dehydrogenase accessory protein MauD